MDIILFSSFSLQEDTEQGTRVGQIIASQQSGSSTIIYTLVDINVPFILNQRTGIITNTRTLNREHQHQYRFHVRAETDDEFAYRSTVTVYVQVRVFIRSLSDSDAFIIHSRCFRILRTSWMKLSTFN